jgi:hypothetical protein
VKETGFRRCFVAIKPHLLGIIFAPNLSESSHSRTLLSRFQRGTAALTEPANRVLEKIRYVCRRRPLYGNLSLSQVLKKVRSATTVVMDDDRTEPLAGQKFPKLNDEIILIVRHDPTPG